MKTLFYLLFTFFFVSMGIAQENEPLQSAPISITEGGKVAEPGDDADMMRARTELSQSKIKPEIESDPPPSDEEKQSIVVEESSSDDGSLDLNEQGKDILTEEERSKEDSSNQAVTAKDERKIKSNERKKAESTFEFDLSSQKRFFSIHGKYVDSPFSNLDPFLEDGSTTIGFRLFQDMTNQFYLSLGADFIHASEDALVPENTRIFQGAVGIQKTHNLGAKFQLLVGIELLLADWNLKKKNSETNTSITFRNFGTGAAFGVLPEVGFRILIGNKIFFDILPGYLHYLGNTEKEFGGFSTGIRAAFEF